MVEPVRYAPRNLWIDAERVLGFPWVRSWLHEFDPATCLVDILELAGARMQHPTEPAARLCEHQGRLQVHWTPELEDQVRSVCRTFLPSHREGVRRAHQIWTLVHLPTETGQIALDRLLAEIEATLGSAPGYYQRVQAGIWRALELQDSLMGMDGARWRSALAHLGWQTADNASSAA